MDNEYPEGKGYRKNLAGHEVSGKLSMADTAEISTEEYILSLDGISKSFGGIQVLSDTTLQLQRGKVMALVGENGAGKSTLINIVSGLFKPDGGSMLLNGEQVHWASPAQAIKKGIAVVHQELTLFPNLTIAENMFAGNSAVHLTFGRINRELMHKRSAEILNMLGFSIDTTIYVGELSLAEQQLVEIAKALVWEPKILVLDEATSALDTNQVKLLFNAVNRLKETGVTIIFVSHRMYEIFEIADQALILKDGKIVAQVGEDQMKTVTEDYLVSCMLGRSVSAIFPGKRSLETKNVLLSLEGMTNGKAKEEIPFIVHPGEIVGLAGLRGHGQEELLRILFGISERKDCKITIEGGAYQPKNPIHAIKSGFGYVPADRKTQGVAQDLPIEVNLTSVNKKKNFSRIRFAKERDMIQEIRDTLRIRQGRWYQPVRSLSGGNQQKVALGKWLKTNFKILLMDEPTRGIDVATKHEIYEFLRSLAEQGVGILAVSTDSLELLGISDRIYVFYDGGIHAMLEGDNLNEVKLTKAIMGV
ncbi:ribose import ATP-binding protein RbsA [Spirochaetia bacterium]|nr:ribose import ATP-binding protein RbsA [Spirochaetia bacterium]